MTVQTALIRLENGGILKMTQKFYCPRRGAQFTLSINRIYIILQSKEVSVYKHYKNITQ